MAFASMKVRPENFHYLTRIHYQDEGDGVWGEHEIDYILFLQKDFDLTPNPNEVSEVFYVQKDNLDRYINQTTIDCKKEHNLKKKEKI